MKHRGIEDQTERLVESLRIGGKQAVHGIIILILLYFFNMILFSRSYSWSS
jgi:hypothetical protein